MSRRVAQTDVALERTSTTDGKTDVDRGSDEQDTSRQERHHQTDPTRDAAVARWTGTPASTSDGQTDADHSSDKHDTSR